ncbi:type II toxin-antitoxin system HicB family antitoxin [Streptomyces sp. NPDC015346]|uniref:type II toxin-antitoxin system HicB family antitoxin n=1 Tax=Streptomyces sp. NPDC015346 TaxID=3364954 RepID=UPI0036FC0810
MPDQHLTFHILYTPDEGGYNALEPVTGTTSWGKDLAEAKTMIAEALELYLGELSSEETAEIAARQADAWSGDVDVTVSAAA